ncbi:MAG: phasin family protein [Acetobacteraceae bacterium]|nr:phasin family protein [Acetobacteraceae bacterium]MCX7684525.1 phasin family protein [Acetobacteraceae bacterium]
MAAEKMAKIANDTAAQGAATAKKMMEDTAAQAKAMMEKSMEQMNKAAEGMFKAVEEMAEFNRGTFDVMAKASQAYMTGMQDLAKQAFAMAQGMAEHALEGFKAVTAAKSLKEASEIQASVAKAALEKCMSETAKMNEAAFKLAEQFAQPVAARVTAAMEKMTKPLAA